MEIIYEDLGSIARLVIKSPLFRFRKHRHAVDAALLMVNVTVKTKGLFTITTVITGKTPAVMRAYKIISRENGNA
ncbi:hypothetical protein [Rosenbergiella epipactidis]|uniref:hypothetical protein n=1 Tax=Rosenbergiella epipactidis TaxID=1544694 RepID=UPI001F4D809D|nr:hypothetical protein [Rosenbergiella epipactidis]